MISVKNLTKTFGQKTAVSELSFEVESGDILGFLGPNGAGKTTTMRILTGFFPPTDGTAVVNGVDVCEDPIKVREMVGYLPERVPLYTDMTTREFLHFAASAKRMKPQAREEAVKRTIERCNLEKVAGQLIGTLSRGYRQRVGLGQAIINNPSVLVLDEPTVGLDPSQVRDIRALLRELGKDATVILSSHILSEVQQMCNRVVIIANGKMQAVGTPEHLTAALHGEVRVSFRVMGAEDEEVEKQLQNLDAVKLVEKLDKGSFAAVSEQGAGDGLAPIVARAVVESGWELHELKIHKADLEEIFIQMVQEKKGDHDAGHSEA